MSARWWIHLIASGGANASHSFHGTREEAEAKAAQYIGKPASWNCNKNPNEPNMWDVYTAWRIEPSVVRAEVDGGTEEPQK